MKLSELKQEADRQLSKYGDREVYLIQKNADLTKDFKLNPIEDYYTNNKGCVVTVNGETDIKDACFINFQ